MKHPPENCGCTARNRKPVLWVLSLFLGFLLFLSPRSQPIRAAAVTGRSADARPSSDGQLTVSGTGLVNQAGETVTLRGFSTHGLTWYPDYVNPVLFGELSENWGANIVRLAMYSEDYVSDKQTNLDLLHAGIDAAIANDMYVLVDWHILEDYNPLFHQEEAAEFFELIASEYAGSPYILYEICNEPNQDCTWEDVYRYSETIIPIIQNYSPNAPIIVGTPEYDQDLESPREKPLPFDNVLYTFHFYTATHHEEMMKKLDAAVTAGLPVFITECGITEADGNGSIDYAYAVKWFDYLHQHNISYVVWNLSNKEETSSFIRASSGERKHPKDSDLTQSGTWIRSLLRGTEPSAIPAGEKRDHYSFLDLFRIQLYSLPSAALSPTMHWPLIAALCALALLIGFLLKAAYMSRLRKESGTYDDLIRNYGDPSLACSVSGSWIKQLLIYFLMFLTMVYLVWRLFYSISVRSGWFAILCNLLLLITELVGFFESAMHYSNLLNVNSHPLPKIKEEDFPDVDIFISTYNESEDLLYRTINGCKHLKYPDPSKVHIWLCDDNRRPGMRKLAETMGVGYFDRPNNIGQKAGNLNSAMARTSSPYVVTLDADMIVRSDFLLETMPYFVYAEQCTAKQPEGQKRHLGIVQTPQCFYDPDVFQFALYSEHHIPNEQDFFYRTIEVGKTSSNSVIYGGSNTILARKAIEAISGFYQDCITEDFATGMLVEAAGFLSLGLETPYASGLSPNTFTDHIKQRTRWGRGVINTAGSLHLMRQKGLTLLQKLSYLSSVIYWYSPFKNLIYVISPLLFAVFMVPVFKCTWIDLLIYWLPMFLLQDLCLRVLGKNAISLKWSSIYETTLMPYLLLPVLKETFGISQKKFIVTNKGGGAKKNRSEELRLMAPFLVLTVLSLIGIVRVLLGFNARTAFGIVIILFWLIRNLYTFIMVLFLINGRDTEDDSESVQVQAGELASIVRDGDHAEFAGITTLMTEHSIKVFLDEPESLHAGDLAYIFVTTDRYEAKLRCIVTNVRHIRFSGQCVCRVELIDFEDSRDEYMQILYDRIPTLPQSLGRDFGTLRLFWRNVVYRLVRTV